MSWAIRLGMTAFRIAYGGFFVAVGIYGAVSLISGHGTPFEPGAGPGADFQRALDAAGFVVPIMLACYACGGLALIFDRTAPLGVVLLAPFVVVIFFYHLMPGGNALWGAFWAAGLLILAWRYRRAFAGLVRFEGSRSE